MANHKISSPQHIILIFIENLQYMFLFLTSPTYVISIPHNLAFSIDDDEIRL